MTKSEELQLVDTAIADILSGGQSTQYQGRSLTMANYRELLARKKELEAEIAQSAAGGRSRVINVTPIT